MCARISCGKPWLGTFLTLLLAVTACSSGDEEPGDTGSESNTAGSGGGSNGGTASGGTSSGGTSSGGSSSGGTSSGGTPSAGGSSSSAGPLLGSCDTRDVAGPSQGQCRDWVGEDSNLDLSVSCNGLDGMYSETEACPSSGRVGQCELGPLLGATAIYGYYAPDYTSDTAADHCSALDGVFTLASTGSGTGGAGGAGGSPPSGGSGGTSCPPECFRPYECVAMCGDEPVSYGCCPCPDGMIDTITCP